MAYKAEFEVSPEGIARIKARETVAALTALRDEIQTALDKGQDDYYYKNTNTICDRLCDLVWKGRYIEAKHANQMLKVYHGSRSCEETLLVFALSHMITQIGETV